MAVTFDLTQPITANMLNINGNLNLYGSWLQYGDVNGDGRINTQDMVLVQGISLGSVRPDQLIMLTADVNKDGRINAQDQVLIQSYFLGSPTVILGTPRP